MPTKTYKVPTLFQSTPSARRATGKKPIIITSGYNFNPRPPRGGRQSESHMSPYGLQFQSTPSARRATIECFNNSTFFQHFNPRPPRGGRQPLIRLYNPDNKISIHALREEGDPCGQCIGCRIRISIHALREEGDCAPAKSTERGCISIHALREEGDLVVFVDVRWPSYFNPRPPRGGRQTSQPTIWPTSIFQSTPSARRATPDGNDPYQHSANFNPRPPRGGRRRTQHGKDV